MEKGKILIVEDDNDLANLITDYLWIEGYTGIIAENGVKGLNIATSEKVELVVLDIMLPELDGITVCRKIREVSNVPIIMLSAKSGEMDKILSLGVGADDYITKPFSLMVLISKVNALMRRVSNESSNKRGIQCKHLKFYVDEMKLINNDEEIILSKNEYKLLNCLINNPLQVVTKEQLLESLWDKDGIFVDENTVAVNIRRLREKIEPIPSEPIFIKNIRGVGYRWNEECNKIWWIKLYLNQK